MRYRCFRALLIIGFAWPGFAKGEVVVIEAAQDNSLFEQCDILCPDTGSDGAGEFLFSGATGLFGLRRAVLAFDVAGAVPAGETITSARLTLYASTPIDGNFTGAHDFTLHRLTASWGEGSSDAGDPGGGGAVPGAGDATWVDRHFPSVPWSGPGGDGDYVESPSATVNVNHNQFYSWGSNAAMVADVQSMLDSPGENFGWMLIGNESVEMTAKRFDSRENATPENRPTLTIEYGMSAAVVPMASRWSLVGLMLVVLAAGIGAMTRGSQRYGNDCGHNG